MVTKGDADYYKEFSVAMLYSKLLGAASCVKMWRGNHCDGYKHSRVEWEGMKFVFDSAHWTQATTLTFN